MARRTPDLGMADLTVFYPDARPTKTIRTFMSDVDTVMIAFTGDRDSAVCYDAEESMKNDALTMVRLDIERASAITYKPLET